MHRRHLAFLMPFAASRIVLYVPFDGDRSEVQEDHKKSARSP